MRSSDHRHRERASRYIYKMMTGQHEQRRVSGGLVVRRRRNIFISHRKHLRESLSLSEYITLQPRQKKKKKKNKKLEQP